MIRRVLHLYLKQEAMEFSIMEQEAQLKNLQKGIIVQTISMEEKGHFIQLMLLM